jgi:endonuclease G
MTKKTIYSVIAIALIISVYGFNFYLDEQISNEVIVTGKGQKEDTNVFFLPTSTTNQVVHHNGYSLSYHEEHEQAEWVAYELKENHITSTNFKRPYFEVDNAVSTKSAHWRNYKQSGYDRGHLCPAGDRKYSKSAHDETFLTSNVSPQKHDFNSGIWNSLEQKVRYWAIKYDGVYVISGGVLSPDLKTIGSENVSVPNYFYKIICDYNQGEPKVIAFLMKHEKTNKPLHSFVVSVDDIELLTGIDFFSQFQDKQEEQLESNSNYKDWSF